MIKIIAIVDYNFGISQNEKIPWSFKKDLSFFYQKTKNSNIVMGKNTLISMQKFHDTENSLILSPLKNRKNIVVSKTLFQQFKSPKENENNMFCEIFETLENVIEKYHDFFIIGGAQIYNYAIEKNYVDIIILTQIKQSYNADKFINFPRKNFTKHQTYYENTYYSIIEYQRN